MHTSLSAMLFTDCPCFIYLFIYFRFSLQLFTPSCPLLKRNTSHQFLFICHEFRADFFEACYTINNSALFITLHPFVEHLHLLEKFSTSSLFSFSSERTFLMLLGFVYRASLSSSPHIPCRSTSPCISLSSVQELFYFETMHSPLFHIQKNILVNADFSP